MDKNEITLKVEGLVKKFTPELDPHLFYGRDAERARLKASFQTGSAEANVLLVLGPHQVGKTTLIQQTLAGQYVVHLDLRDESVGNIKNIDHLTRLMKLCFDPGLQYFCWHMSSERFEKFLNASRVPNGFMTRLYSKSATHSENEELGLLDLKHMLHTIKEALQLVLVIY